MELEDELGKKMFIRGNRRITLTEDGIFLRKRAQEIVDLADRTEQELSTSDDLVSGDVYIGCGETDAMRLIARVVKKLRSDYPLIHCHLFSGNAEDVTERLDKGLLDFGILIESGNVYKYDYLRLPAADTWGVLMRKDHPLAALSTITPEDLWEIPLLCSRQAVKKNELSGWLGDDSEKLNIIGTYNLIFNAALMVEEGVGCALCLDKIIHTGNDSLLCFKPLEPLLKAQLEIVWKKHSVFSKASEKFLKQLYETLSDWAD